MGVFIGIDAGGTKTRCRIAEGDRVLAQASGGTVKIMNVGEETATRRLLAIVSAAAKEAAISLDTVERTCIGLAGISSEAVRSWAERTLRGLVSGGIMLVGDEEIALESAFRGGAGIFVIAGTGSHVVGRCSDGTRMTAGGWGPMLGDEGSGSWIGLEAIRAALRAKDRGVQTCLLRGIESFWQLGSLGELIAKANHRPRPDFAELATVVAACADDGDALAMSVLLRAGEELAEQVGLVASKMKSAGCAPNDALRVAFTGSVLQKITTVRRSMEEHLVAITPGMRVAQVPVEPLEGALWLAARRPVLAVV